MRMTTRPRLNFLGFLALCGLLTSWGAFTFPSLGHAQEPEAEGDPAEIVIGERLFLETRFAQFFKQFLDGGGNTNNPLPAGDPMLNTTVTTGGPLPGPFAGQSMNCRACHLVDAHLDQAGGGMRTYTDFARRSPVPAREDGATTSPRHSPPLVNSTLPRKGGLLLHFDGEFASTVDLIKSTFAGRNFGGLPYSVVLTGTDPTIPDEFRLPAQFRVVVPTATDLEIFTAVAKLVAAYTEGLIFSQDDAGVFNLSPYDVFLKKNGLPRTPAARETPLRYSRRLLRLIEQKEREGPLSWVATLSEKPRRHRRHHRHPKFVKQNPFTDDGRF